MNGNGTGKLAFKGLQYDALKPHLLRSKLLSTTANSALIHDKVFQNRHVARAIAAAIVITEGVIYSKPGDKRIARKMLGKVPEEAVEEAWKMLEQTDLSPPPRQRKEKKQQRPKPAPKAAPKEAQETDEKEPVEDEPPERAFRERRVSIRTLQLYADKSELIKSTAEGLLQEDLFKNKRREGIIAAALLIEARITESDGHDKLLAKDILVSAGKEETKVAFRMLLHHYGGASPVDPQTNDDRLLLHAMKCARDSFLKNNHLRLSEGRFYLDHRKVYAKLAECSLLDDFWMWVKDDHLYRDGENSWKRKPDPEVLRAGRQRLRGFIDAIKSKKPWAIEHIRKMRRNGFHGNPPPLEEMFFEMHTDLFNALARRGLIIDVVKEND